MPAVSPPPAAPRSAAGFSLVEALVALVVLALALLLGLGLIWQQRGILQRLDERQAADRALEAALEALRSGALELPAGSGVVRIPVELLGGEAVLAAGGRGVEVVVRVVPAEPPADLYRAWVQARYEVGGERRTREVETLFWRPGKIKPP